MTYISTLQYGPIIFKDSYKTDDDSKNYIADRISLYFLISYLVVLFPSLLLGYILDRVKNWKVLAIFQCLLLGSLTLFVLNTPLQDHIYSVDNHQSSWMTFGFIGTCTISPCLFLVNQSLLTKSIAECTFSRGVFLSASAMIGSIGIFIIDGVGGNMYDSNKRNPFFLCIGMVIFLLLVTFLLACFRQLRV